MNRNETLVFAAQCVRDAICLATEEFRRHFFLIKAEAYFLNGIAES